MLGPHPAPHSREPAPVDRSATRQPPAPVLGHRLGKALDCSSTSSSASKVVASTRRAPSRRRSARSIPPAGRERVLRAARPAPRERSAGSRRSRRHEPRWAEGGMPPRRQRLGPDVAMDREDDGVPGRRGTCVRRARRRSGQRRSARAGIPSPSTRSSRLVSLSETSSQKKRPCARSAADAVAVGGLEPVEDLRHGASRLGSPQDVQSPGLGDDRSSWAPRWSGPCMRRR